MPHTITITPDAGVFRASLVEDPDVTATGETEACALKCLAARIEEHGWDWSELDPKPVKAKKSKTDPAKPSTQSEANPHETPAKP